eukprot:15270158-Alexandrium_andersonii.AAC.1
MSASLVGSEMCIRDRYKAVATAATAHPSEASPAIDLPMDIDGKALTNKDDQLKKAVVKFIVDSKIAQLKKDEQELQDQWEGVCQEFAESLVPGAGGQDVAAHSEGIDKAILGATDQTNGMQL